MADYVKNMSELRGLKKKLKRGGQRELARRMGTVPARISDAFDGFVRDSEFLGRLVVESKKLLSEEAVRV